jgi:hypothetical protein
MEQLAKLRAETADLRAQLEQERQGRETLHRTELASVATTTAAPTPATVDNADDKLVAGTVPEVTADLGGKTDDELNAMLAAENDREKPRAGVLKAIEAEQTARKETVEA